MQPSSSAAPPASPSSMPPLNFDNPSKIVGLDYSDDHVLHAPSLRFAVTPTPFGAGTGARDTDDGRRLIAAVDAALARRSAAGDNVDVDDLEINFVYGSPRNRYIGMASGGFYLFRHGHAADITSCHVAAWLRFAERRVTGRFTLAVPVLPRQHAKKTAAAAAPPPERKLYAEMPASARCSAMSLTLGNATVSVPAVPAGAAAFAALTDLHLSHARIPATGANERNLGDMLSAGSCPRLRRLRLEHVAGLAALRLRAATTLEELRLNNVRDMAALELDAPGLRALHVADCYRLASDDAAVAVSAPRLETLACADMCRPERLRFDGAANVRRLDKIFLWSHGRPGVYSNAGAVWLLQHCSAANSLGVHISPPVAKNWKDMEEMMSPVPQLPNITSLTIDAQWQHLEASVAKLIVKCSRLERLTIDFSRPCDPCSNPRCFCYREAGWDDQNISLEHLREGKITGLRPSDDHLSLVQRVIASAPALERMTVELYIGKELDCSSIPCNRGHWAPCVSGQSSRRVCNQAYEWTPGKKRDAGQLVVHPGKRSLHPLLFCSKTSCVLPRKRSNEDL
ncbi:unnamed protein product [Urochloa decumbens]|uniref:F-box/LRR-repeat protein 15/At3g58940/PEG3-like LRR domain-containing protein n=1 Tax=Urochloa decumbens TaxID=240449 RepID=A0ABC8VJE3_9POAL